MGRVYEVFMGAICWLSLMPQHSTRRSLVSAQVKFVPAVSRATLVIAVVTGEVCDAEEVPLPSSP